MSSTLQLKVIIINYDTLAGWLVLRRKMVTPYCWLEKLVKVLKTSKIPDSPVRNNFSHVASHIDDVPFIRSRQSSDCKSVYASGV